MFILVNKNHLVPSVETLMDKELTLNKLIGETVHRTNEYSSNVYAVECDSNGYELQIYYFEQNKLYCSNLNQCENPKNDRELIYTYEQIVWRNQKFTGLYKLDSKPIVQTQTQTQTQFENIEQHMNDEKTKDIEQHEQHEQHMDDVEQAKNMSLSINDYCAEKPDKFIIGDKFDAFRNQTEKNENTINNESIELKESTKSNELKELAESTKSAESAESAESSESNDKLNKLLEAIEEVNSSYQMELAKVRNLELSLKSYDKKILKLEKTKREEMFFDVIKTQSEYRTWKKLKYKIESEADILKPIEELELNDKDSPILFLSKYEYFDKMLAREEIRKLFDELNLLNLDQLYTKDELPCENILLFCKKYAKISKDLHYKFDHDWSHLDFEMNMNSTNKLFVPK